MRSLMLACKRFITKDYIRYLAKIWKKKLINPSNSERQLSCYYPSDKIKTLFNKRVTRENKLISSRMSS